LFAARDFNAGFSSQIEAARCSLLAAIHRMSWQIRPYLQFL